MSYLNIALLKITDEELAHLQKMVREGWATDIEAKLWQHVSSMSYEARQDSINSFLLTMDEE